MAFIIAMALPQRVHIAPVGYETERIISPALDHNINKIVLLAHGNRTTKSKNCLGIVQTELSRENIDFQIKNCDFFDLDSSLWAMAEAIKKYGRDDVFINLSTGSKITAIAGMIACMASNAHPFYVPAEEYTGETISKGAAEPIDIPTYAMKVPDEQFIQVLEFIDSNDEVIKGDIVEFTQDFPLLSGYNRKKLTDMYGPVKEHIIEPLLEGEYIKEQRHGKDHYLFLTERGEDTLDIFRYMLS